MPRCESEKFISLTITLSLIESLPIPDVQRVIAIVCSDLGLKFPSESQERIQKNIN